MFTTLSFWILSHDLKTNFKSYFKNWNLHKQVLKIIPGKFCHFKDLTPSWSQNITKYSTGKYDTSNRLLFRKDDFWANPPHPKGLLVLEAHYLNFFQLQVSWWFTFSLDSAFCFVICPHQLALFAMNTMFLTFPAYPQISPS